MNENDYSITPLSVLSNVSALDSTKDNENRKKRRNRKKSIEENSDLIAIEEQTFRDEQVNQRPDDGDGHQIDFCA